MIKNTFSKETTESNLNRLEKLSHTSQAQWGKMNAGQMLAHLSVAYDKVFNENTPKAKGLKRFFLKTFVKNMVVSEKPYPKNSRTAPEFLITDQRDFEQEKTKLIAHINKVHQLGASYFEGKENVAFGALTAKEWSNMFQKHLEHHFKQFGV